MREQQLHAFTVQLLRVCAAPGVLWLHIPMGVQSSHGGMAGKWARVMGARPGTADFLLIKDGRATFLELKTERGKLSPAQKLFSGLAGLAGADVHVARTPEQVVSLLRDLGMLRTATIAA
jgi:hypothetical protein